MVQKPIAFKPPPPTSIPLQEPVQAQWPDDSTTIGMCPSTTKLEQIPQLPSEDAVGRFSLVQLANGQFLESQAPFYDALFRSMENPRFDPSNNQSNPIRSQYEAFLPIREGVSLYTDILMSCLLTHRRYGPRLNQLDTSERESFTNLVSSYLRVVALADNNLGTFYRKLGDLQFSLSRQLDVSDDESWTYIRSVLEQTSCSDQEWIYENVSSLDLPIRDTAGRGSPRDPFFRDMRRTILLALTLQQEFSLPRVFHHEQSAGYSGVPPQMAELLGTLSQTRGAAFDQLMTLFILSRFPTVFADPYQAFKSPSELFLNKTTPSFDFNNQVREAISKYISWKDLGMAHYSSFGFYRPQRWIAELQYTYPLGFSLIPLVGSTWDVLDSSSSLIEGRQANGQPTDNLLQSGIFALNLASSMGDYFGLLKGVDKAGKYLDHLRGLKTLARQASTVEDIIRGSRATQEGLEAAGESLHQVAAALKADVGKNFTLGYPSRKNLVARHVNRVLGYVATDALQIKLSKEYDRLIDTAASFVSSHWQKTSYDEFQKQVFEQFKDMSIWKELKADDLMKAQPMDYSKDSVINGTPITHSLNTKYSSLVPIVQSAASEMIEDPAKLADVAAKQYQTLQMMGAGDIMKVPGQIRGMGFDVDFSNSNMNIWWKRMFPEIKVDGKAVPFPGAHAVYYENNLGLVETGVAVDGTLKKRATEFAKGYAYIIHSFPQNGRSLQMMEDAKRYQDTLFKKAMDPRTSRTEYIRLIAEIFYLDCHMFRYNRGTNSTAWLSMHAMLSAKGECPTAVARNVSLDVTAQTSRSFEDFYEHFQRVFSDKADNLYINEAKGYGPSQFEHIASPPSPAKGQWMDLFSRKLPQNVPHTTTKVMSVIKGKTNFEFRKQAGILGSLTKVARVRSGGLLLQGSWRHRNESLKPSDDTDVEFDAVPSDIPSSTLSPAMVSIIERPAQPDDPAREVFAFLANQNRPIESNWRDSNGDKFSYFIPEDVRTKLISGQVYEAWISNSEVPWATYLGSFDSEGTSSALAPTPTPRSSPTAAATPKPAATSTPVATPTVRPLPTTSLGGTNCCTYADCVMRGSCDDGMGPVVCCRLVGDGDCMFNPYLGGVPNYVTCASNTGVLGSGRVVARLTCNGTSVDDTSASYNLGVADGRFQTNPSCRQ